MSGARPDTWMPFYIGDYLRDTQHLNAEKHGAYVLLIFAYWASGKPLPDDDEHLATICRMPIKRWLAIKTVIARFFQQEAGEWRHKRVDRELQRSTEITEKRRAAGIASAQQRASKPPTHVEQVYQQTGRPSQSQSQIEKDDASASSGARKGNGNDRSSRGTRLSPDWQPSAEDRDFAATLELDPDAAAAEFRDYWCAVPGSKGTKLDWSATYRNRCRELATRGKRAAIQRSGPATGIAQGFADALRMGAREPDEDSRSYQPPPRALLGRQ